MITQIEIENKLANIKSELFRKFYVDKIGYFGSFSENTQNENSDIDILVHFKKPIGWEFFDLQDLLEKELQRKIDLVSINALKKQLRNIILKQVKYV